MWMYDVPLLPPKDGWGGPSLGVSLLCGVDGEACSLGRGCRR